jgi:hypothetical protein
LVRVTRRDIHTQMSHHAQHLHQLKRDSTPTPDKLPCLSIGTYTAPTRPDNATHLVPET